SKQWFSLMMSTTCSIGLVTCGGAFTPPLSVFADSAFLIMCLRPSRLHLTERHCPLSVSKTSELSAMFQHGADRTGTVIACYRIRHDKWTSKQALLEAKEYGMSPLEIGMKRYVAEFEKSHKPDFFLGRPMK